MRLSISRNSEIESLPANAMEVESEEGGNVLRCPKIVDQHAENKMTSATSKVFFKIRHLVFN